MRILIRIVFVIFIAKGIDCLGKVCDNCCDCFKEKKENKKKEEYEEIEDEGNNKAESLVNENWFNAKKNLVLKIFEKEENSNVFTSTENGDKISFKWKIKGNTKIIYQNEAENKLKLNGKKYAFFEIKTNTDKTVYLYCNDIESYEDIGGIFEETTHVSISVIACDTEKVKNMKDMFHKCESLTKLDLKNFNTTNVTGMRGMFSNCSSLENLDLNNFNTTKVTDMGYMFCGCKNLKELKFEENFNTEKVTDMRNMFSGCSSFPENIQNKNVEEIINFFKGKNK